MALRLWLRRFALLVLLAASVGIIVLGRTQPWLFDRARVLAADFTLPIMDMLSRPAAAIGDWVNETRAIMDIRAENRRLREENAQLLQWRVVARQAELENRQLRELLDYQGRDAASSVTGRVIGVGGRFIRSVLLDVGTDRGVRKGQTAMAGDGLVGRVAMVGRRSSRVLLITDLNSRIPVLVEETNARAILAGDNGYQPRLLYPTAGADLQPGQHVVTSGHGGTFPPGLPIGMIASVQDGLARVQPFVAIDRQEYIRLLNFGLDGVLEPLETPDRTP